jgi:AcrR family transcriptional regulator
MPEILDAAARIFRQKGYEASSMQDIADSVGILKGSLYHYIETKEDLLYGIMTGVLDDLVPQFERWRALEGSSLNRIAIFVDEYVQHIIRNRVKVGVFFSSFDSLSPPRRRVVIESKDRYDNFLRDLIVRGQADGSVSSDIDPRLATLAIYGSANATHEWFRPRGGKNPEEIGEALAELAKRSLAPRELSLSR